MAWKGLAETIDRYLSKGFQVGISGSLQQRTWQNNAGDTRSTVEIVVRNLTLLDSKRRESVPPVEDDDIPF
ncbi:MAG: single-stranded DNA-binding protein [Deltaproteobacteria bacterium]|nr:single-stranded DNA-binding protein [Deltaproteobacteria bacterium]